MAGMSAASPKVSYSTEGEDHFYMTDLLVEFPARQDLPSGPGKNPGGALLPLRSGPKRCPVVGCDERIDPSRLMCRSDWYLIPHEIRGRIWATWRSGEAALSSKHQATVHKAIAFAHAVRSALGDRRSR
jgi:hypothetical protein